MRKLGMAQIGMLAFEVFESSEEECPSLEKRWGWTDTDKQRICIREGMHPVRRRIVLIHEILHAVNEASGVNDWLPTMMPSGAVFAFEEALVSKQAMCLAQALESLKLMAPPRKGGKGAR